MARFLIGLDPSFTNTGIAILDLFTRTISLHSYGSPIGAKTYRNILLNAQERCQGILSLINRQIGDDYCIIISETPPALGAFSSGLYALDVHLHSILKLMGNCEILYGVPPTYLGHIHGKRSYKKSESVTLCKEILEVFSSNGFTLNPNGRISADKAEAFLFLVRLYVLEKSDFLSSYLMLRQIKYFDNKEFEL